ncbi:M3 family oligoendopeptidase [Parendozoicomonas haliclonae]|uniref:Oligoendopeptidase F, plasmid n=1 Tax=Parendozoicomonas haliclonae TaxID=1960125 RepID=A0A1X7AIB3_9GAMM|nr:M3 family oligoendopeptidase [Parendozoicomonas haliclonae]SMA44150.1 Oligoendopeptidase F, plasmid [Parendozoicomonas haliclonae]
MSIANDKSIPSWDNSKIYSDFDDPAIEADISRIQTNTKTIAELAESLQQPLQESQFDQIEKILTVYDQTLILLATLYTYGSSGTSVDVKDAAASKLCVRMGSVDAELEQAFTVVDQLLIQADEKIFDALFTRSSIEAQKFGFAYMRKFRVHYLSADEEVVLAAVKPDGLEAWGRLYSELAGSLRCTVNGKEVGLAEASNLVRGADAATRLSAWEGIQAAWKGGEIPAAAILNAINGWRHQENKLRSKVQDLHYLDVSCRQSRIERETLNSLMTTVYEKRAIGQKALVTMAKGMGVERLGPQDILAPCPVAEGSEPAYYPFDQAIEIVAEAFSEFDPEMGEFAQMMYKNNWIDALPSESRSTGAYCTEFANVREPRVFMTWDGSIGNVITLAHELGHAWHNWVMRDMPEPNTHYPMTLAETASIFAETLVRDALFAKAKSDQDRYDIAWQDAEGAAAFLINIPSRFEFEQRMVEQRRDTYIPADELSTMMEQSWEKWYEDSLTGYDPMFWASKLHFSIAGLGFYNYPYLFGYLFSLGIYAQKDKLGENFRGAYRELLRDTGRMTAEELVEKHLGKDIRQPEFWLDSIAIVEGLVSRFETLVEDQ